jgi:hypothetical protein
VNSTKQEKGARSSSKKVLGRKRKGKWVTLSFELISFIPALLYIFLNFPHFF